MKKTFYLVISILFSCSYSDSTILVTNNGEAQGSYYHIKYMSEYGEDYHFQIDSILQEVDSSLSIYKSYSLISNLNSEKQIKTDDLFNAVFLSAQQVFLETKGSFDCSIFPLVKAWGFYKNELGDSIVIDSAKFRNILDDIGFEKIKLIDDTLYLPRNMRLDFNSIAQGFTVDLIGDYLDSKRINNYLIEVGGEILAKGRKDDGSVWRVGVDKPLNDIDANERFQFILDLENKAMATSGNYRKFYEINGLKYSHTINPSTGFPVQNNLLSVTVIHDDCMLADAYATAFMVMGVEKTKQFVVKNTDIEIYLVYGVENGEWNTYISPLMRKRIIN
jgi:thiamine biosynthesis lipoprotein